MKKNFTTIMTTGLRGFVPILLCITLIFVLAGCGKDPGQIDYSQNPINMETNQDAVENLTVTYVGEVTTLNPSFISYIHEQEFITNIYDSLTAIDAKGEVIPSVAESWEHSPDYKTWTFHLRDDCYWVDSGGNIKRTVKARDFITGLEFCTNYAKSEGISSYIACETVAGANDYQEYTMSLSEDEALSLTEKDFTDMVGISAPDDVTVVIKTSEACPYMPSVASSANFVPAPKEHIDEVGLEDYIINSYQTAWYNGPYVLTEYIKNNERIIDANPHWYGNKDHTRFKSVTYKCVEDSSLAYQLYQNNEVDVVYLSQSQLKRIMDDKNNKYHGKTITRKSEGFAGFLIFNFDKADDEDWNKAVANTAFRKAFLYGIDNYPICRYHNRINPEAIDVKTVQPYGGGSLSDGTQYKDLVISMLDFGEKEGNKWVRNKPLFEKYKKQAMRELAAQGVKFPVNVDYYVSAASAGGISYGRVLQSMIENSLGTDFVKFNIKTYSSSFNIEVLDKHAASILDAGYAYDYEDPSNILALFLANNTGSFIYEYTNSYLMTDQKNITGDKSYRGEFSRLLKEYDRMYYDAKALNDNDERMRAFAELEKYLIDTVAFVVPCFNERNEMLTNIDPDSLSVSSLSGYDRRYVDRKTHQQK